MSSKLNTGQIRSFISIDVEDPGILSEIDSIASTLVSLGGDLKPVERENIHLTLKFLGDVTTVRISQLRSVLAEVKFSPFNLEIKGAGAFPSLGRMNVIWVGLGDGSIQVEEVFNQIETQLTKIGFARETRGFSPHITIARVRSGRRREEIADFLKKLDGRVFGSFTANSVRLKQSILSGSGPKYSDIFDLVARV